MTWLMVFPRKAGFGRCYLVPTRHEILSNIDRNLTGTLLRLRKNRNKINPRESKSHPSFIVVFESQTVVFQLFDFHLRKFKMFIIKKVLLSQSDVPAFNPCDTGWLLKIHQEDNWGGTDPHRFPPFYRNRSDFS